MARVNLKDKRIFDLPQEKHIEQVYKLWQTNSLCDVTIAAGGREFFAHRLILSASSQYFKAMFNSGMEECKSGKVDLPDVTSLSMDLILNAIYRQDLELNSDIIDDLLAVAHRLEFTEILHCCEKYITEELVAPNNCLYYLRLGEKYDLKSITDSAQNCLLTNFSLVCVQDKFLELSKEVLLQYVRSELLNCESELEVFWALIRWIQHETGRKEHAGELLKSVRYGLMTPRELLNDVWKETMVVDNEECQDLIKNAIEFHSNPNVKPIISETWCRPRFTVEHLVILSGRFLEDDVFGGCGHEQGYGEFPPARMLFKFPITIKEKETMRALGNEMAPFSNTYDSSGAGVQIGHYLFVFGGYHKYADEIRSNSVSASNTCWRFNSIEGAIDQLNNMDLARVHHVAVQLDKDKILVAGGANDSAEDTDSCDIYNIERNSWTIAARLPRRLVYMASCAHDGSVYISGGKSDDDDLAVKSLYKYDRQRKRWTSETDMYKRRMQHVMCSVNQRIYVFGGAPYDRETDGVTESEYYDPETSQWTAFTTRDAYSFTPEVLSSCFVHDNLVYILGGSHAGRYYDRSSVFRFDPETHVSERSNLPYGISKSIMVVMPFSVRKENVEDYMLRNFDGAPPRSRSPREHWRSRSRSWSRSTVRSPSGSRSRSNSMEPSSDGY